DMKKRILILSCAISLATQAIAHVGAIDSNRPDREHGYEHKNDKQQKYTCPMHPEVVTDYPGKCPKCGMTLVPLKPKSKTPTSNEADMHHHDHGMMNHEEQRAAASHSMEQHQMKMSMQSTVNIAEPMSRESSGTSWVPDSTPMYGKMIMFGDDMLMLHGAIFPRYTIVSTRRGDDRIDAPNWIMGMYSHPIGESAQLGGRLMMSL